ncbi:MAG: dihydrofolate reductase family protein [Actinobacteria bacterium]|nr:dihydrofolate reductase family protein [Actinomycetota bacterium]
MRRVVAAEFVSLDGVMEDPGGVEGFVHGGWTIPFWSDELAEYQSEQLFASDALLLGRRTYEVFAAAWPSRSGDPFTDRMNSLPKLVVSTTLSEPLKWNARLVEGDPVESVRGLKQEPGQDLLIYGSGTLVQTLLRHGLIDSYRLMVYPVVLGSGKRLFAAETARADLRLTSTKTTSSGVAMLTYEAAEDSAADAG